MATKNHELVYNNTSGVLGVLAGVFIGGLAGAVTMLLLAPQSGEDTRTKIQEKSIELRDHTTEMVEDAMAKIRAERKKLTVTGQHKAKELLHQGQDLVVEQLDHVADAAKAGKRAIQNS
jgi:gas vesicle protein